MQGPDWDLCPYTYRTPVKTGDARLGIVEVAGPGVAPSFGACTVHTPQNIIQDIDKIKSPFPSSTSAYTHDVGFTTTKWHSMTFGKWPVSLTKRKEKVQVITHHSDGLPLCRSIEKTPTRAFDALLQLVLH